MDRDAPVGGLLSGDDGARIEALLAEAAAGAAGAREGLFGPRSLSWRIGGELAILLGGGRALLLQLAHPAVAQAVEEHSALRVDPLGRARRTFEIVYRVVFGDLPSALAAARRIHRRHEPVRGENYRAADPALLLWVHATLIDTELRCYEALVRRLTPPERDRFYDETRRLACAYGIPRDLVPPSLPAFERYVARMVEGPELVVIDVARAQAELLLAPLAPGAAAALLGPRSRLLARLVESGPIRRALHDLSRQVTIGLLPPQLRGGYGLPWSETDERRLTRDLAIARQIVPRLPAALRLHPAYRRAMARAAG